MEKFSVCLIQPEGYLHSLALLEVGQLVSATIESLGFPCRFVANQIQPDAINVVVGYHLLDSQTTAQLAGHRLIFYQLEQLSEREGWFTPLREAVLRQAWAIWDYSPENVAFLKGRGFDRVDLLPLGYHPSLEKIRHRDEAGKDIDVLFYGSVNQRRAVVLEALRRRFRMQTLFGVYGEARDQYIARAKIVLNVHFYESKILEQVRLSYLLNNGCFIVSEQAERNPFADGIVLGKADELLRLCEEFLAQPEKRREIANHGRRAFQQQPMVERLKPVLEALRR